MNQNVLSEETESNTNYLNERNLADSNRQGYLPPENSSFHPHHEENLPEFRFITDGTGVQPSPYM